MRWRTPVYPCYLFQPVADLCREYCDFCKETMTLIKDLVCNCSVLSVMDQWEFVRPCIVLKFSVSYWNGPIGICTTLIILKLSVLYWNGPIGICTTLYRTKPFRTILKHLVSYTYAPKGLNYFYIWYSMVLIQVVWPCMALNV